MTDALDAAEKRIDDLLRVAHSDGDHLVSAPLCAGCQKIRELRAAIHDLRREAFGAGLEAAARRMELDKYNISCPAEPMAAMEYLEAWLTERAAAIRSLATKEEA